MNKPDINAFVAQLEKKNSWGKNEVIDLFKEWAISVLLRELDERKDKQIYREVGGVVKHTDSCIGSHWRCSYMGCKCNCHLKCMACEAGGLDENGICGECGAKTDI